MKNADTKNRHMDLSKKFAAMGETLIKEGEDNKDFNTTEIGHSLIFLSGIIFSEHDLLIFRELVTMFSAKMLLEHIEKTQTPISKLMKMKSDDESMEDFMKRINKMRDDLGHFPLF